MSEYSHSERPHVSLCTESVYRLRSDIDILHDAVAIQEAFITYLQAEFELSNTDAESLFHEFGGDQLLSEAELFEQSPENARTSYRLLMFSHVMPYYQERRTSDEFKQWLSGAINMIVPPDGDHSPYTCLHPESKLTGHCRVDDAIVRCPLKLLVDSTTEQLIHPPFDSFSYLVESEKMRQNTHVVLDAMRKRHFMSEGERFQLESCYEYNYRRIFEEPQK